MNKIIFFILIVVGISYGQSGNPVVDSLTAHRTAINLKSPLASPTFTGTLTSPAVSITGTLNLGDSKYLYFGASEDMTLVHDGTDSWVYNNTGILKFGTSGGTRIGFYTSGIERWSLNSSGTFLPYVDATYDIGSYTVRPDSIYADDISVTNTVVGTNLTANTALTVNSIDVQDSLEALGSLIATNTSGISGLSTAQGGVIQDSIYAQVIPIGVSLSYPSASEFIPLLRVPFDITIDAIYVGIVGGTSVNYNLHFGTSILNIKNGTYTEVLDGYGQITSAAGTAETETYNTQNIDAGNWLVFETEGLSGTVEYVVLTINATRR